MNVDHQGRNTELPDEWWSEAGMSKFKPSTKAYRCAPATERVCLIPISDIEPVGRDSGVSIFKGNDDEGISAKDRVQNILRGFVEDAELPPVHLTKQQEGQYPFLLRDGVHRLYCSIAAGFIEIPAIRFPDLDAGPGPELC